MSHGDTELPMITEYIDHNFKVDISALLNHKIFRKDQRLNKGKKYLKLLLKATVTLEKEFQF